MAALALIVLGGRSGSAQGQVCINEVLYDPAGPDEGAEFVELYNSSQQQVSLAGWRLEAGNGASPGDWRTQWQGEAHHTIRPGACFLIAGAAVTCAADARAPLSLQNGPDAVRLVTPQGVVDLVGWGNHTHGEFYEGAAAEDAVSGWSLARVPDGRDTQSNAADFLARPWPSPGAPNAAAGVLALSDLSCDPPILDADTPALLEASVTNLGLEPVALDELEWHLDANPLQVADVTAPAGRLEPASVGTCRWTLAQPGSEVSGVVSATASIVGPGVQGDPLTIQLRVGRTPVVVSEIQYDPAPGEGEWVEICNLSAEEIDLTGWRLRDASGRTTLISPGPATLSPGACALLAEDAPGLRARWPDLPADAILARSGSWPGLNNSVVRELGYADEVVLIDADAVVADYVRYSPGGLDGGGITLERWIEDGRLVEPRLLIACPSAGGATPGLAGGLSVSDSPRGEWLEPQPSPFIPDDEGGARLCSVRVPAPAGGAGRLSAAIYSLAGRHVATLCAAAQVHGPSVLLWDGRDSAGRRQPTGLYLVRIDLVASAGASCDRRLVRPLTLVRG
jgi:hypothetical protein